MKSGSSTMARASSTSESWLRVCTMRPWWNVSAQNEHSPKQPRLLVRLNFTSLMAGTPPAASYIGWYVRAYGSRYTASISLCVSGAAGGFCTTNSWLEYGSTRRLPVKGSLFSYCTAKLRAYSSLSSCMAGNDGNVTASYTCSSDAARYTVPSMNVRSSMASPAFNASAISMMECSPMPYDTRSAPESSRMERFSLSDQ